MRIVRQPHIERSVDHPSVCRMQMWKTPPPPNAEILELVGRGVLLCTSVLVDSASQQTSSKMPRRPTTDSLLMRGPTMESWVEQVGGNRSGESMELRHTQDNHKEETAQHEKVSCAHILRSCSQSCILTYRQLRRSPTASFSKRCLCTLAAIWLLPPQGPASWWHSSPAPGRASIVSSFTKCKFGHLKFSRSFGKYGFLKR